MDLDLNLAVIERDWAAFVAQSARLTLGVPTSVGTDIFVQVQPFDTHERFVAVLGCDGYDTIAPVLDFADITDPSRRGAPYWPKMAQAPMNNIIYNGVNLPIICTPGTRGYHLHSSHCAESWPPSTWRLPKIASLLWRLTHQMGPYQGRGV